MKVRIIMSGNKKEVMGFLNKLMECHGRKARVSDVFPHKDDRYPLVSDTTAVRFIPNEAC